ncbi:MAG: LPS translocon maturation chaperone LptM [Parvibaculales bacterium]
MRTFIIVMTLAGLTLSACGRRGELYYPEAQSLNLTGPSSVAGRE